MDNSSGSGRRRSWLGFDHPSNMLKGDTLDSTPSSRRKDEKYSVPEAVLRANPVDAPGTNDGFGWVEPGGC